MATLIEKYLSEKAKKPLPGLVIFKIFLGVGREGGECPLMPQGRWAANSVHLNTDPTPSPET
jgi:hypothetical protein